MDSSFTPIEQMLKFRASRHEDFPFQEILLTRLCMHMQGKLLENRNKMLKAQGINETGNDSNLLIVFYVQIMPDDFVMQLHRF